MMNQPVALGTLASFKNLVPTDSSLNCILKRANPLATLSFILRIIFTSTFLSVLLRGRVTVSFTNFPEKAIHLLANLIYRYLSCEFSNDYIETVIFSMASLGLPSFISL